MKMIWKRALPLGLLGTGSLWYGGCVAQLIHHVNQRKAQTMAVLQTPSSESVPLSPEQAELCRIRSPLMNRFMEFYQPLKGMDHLDLSDVLAEDLSFQDHGVSCQGWWAVNRIRPQNGGWFSRSFDTRLIHLAHDVGGTQGVELTVRHMFVFRWSKTYFTLWNKIVLDLEGPAGETFGSYWEYSRVVFL